MIEELAHMKTELDKAIRQIVRHVGGSSVVEHRVMLSKSCFGKKLEKTYDRHKENSKLHNAIQRATGHSYKKVLDTDTIVGEANGARRP